MNYVLPPPHRHAKASYRTPDGRGTVELVSRPGAGVAYAGVVPGSPGPADHPVEVPKALYSAAWTPQGPTLTHAQRTERAQRKYLEERDRLEGDLFAMGATDLGGQLKGLAVAGLAGAAILYLIWRK